MGAQQSHKIIGYFLSLCGLYLVQTFNFIFWQNKNYFIIENLNPEGMDQDDNTLSLAYKHRAN